MNKNIVAVVTAKGTSIGVPGKNMKYLGEYPLFWHSVRHADMAGIPCVVATDSPAIKEHVMSCRHSMTVPVHVVDVGYPQVSQIKAAMDLTGTDWFVLLQPTSPFRKISTLMEMVADSQRSRCITVSKVKFQGVFNGKFYNQGPRQNPETKFFYAFDGNIAVGKRAEIEAGNIFDQSCSYLVCPQESPYTLDIDTPMEFDIASVIYDSPIGRSLC